MAQQSYRANLSASAYPFLLSRSAGSVIIPGPDQNYDRRVDPTGETSPPGIPQAIYLENVLPTTEGYKSVGYLDLPSLPWTGATAFLEIKSTKTQLTELLALRVGAQTAVRWTGAIWQTVGVVGGSGAPGFGPNVSYAITAGDIRIFDGDNIWRYNLSGTSSPYLGVLQREDGITLTTGTYTPAGVLTGLKAISSSYNYLLLLKDSGSQVQVVWSSLLSATDFVPSLVTGSGGGAVADAQGRAVSIRASDKGFYVWNTANLLMGTYTGNSRYPFRFKAVKNGTGIRDASQIYGDIDESVFYYTNTFHAPLAIVEDSAQRIGTELAEFLEHNSVIDTFDSATDTFSVEALPPRAKAGVPYLFAGRYLCMSVDKPEQLLGREEYFRVVYVYDTLLRRYGRLVVNHTHLCTVFTDAVSEHLGVLNVSTGIFKLCDIASAFPAAVPSGVLLLGRFQGVRSRRLILEELRIAKATAPNFAVRYYTTENSLDMSAAITPYYHEAASSQASKKYLSRTEGNNVSILLKGGFDVSLVELVYQLGGDS